MQKRILTVMLTVLMLTAVLSGCAPEKYYSITELPETDFSEMTYGEADYMSQFNEAVSAVREKVHVGADFSEIESILDGMDNILIEIQNNFDLSLIHMRLDNSAENIAKNKTASDNIHAVSETYNTLLDELYNSEYKQQFLDSAEGEFDEEDFLNKPSDRFYELKKLETELIAEYYQKSGNAVNSNDTTLGVLFKELVNVRTEIAKERGYDSYADYAYKEVFNRDYTTDDTEKLHKHIKEIVAPISAELAKKSSMNTWGEGNFTEDEVLKFLGTCAEGMGSEVKAAYDCMLENHLYSMTTLQARRCQTHILHICGNINRRLYSQTDRVLKQLCTSSDILISFCITERMRKDKILTCRKFIHRDLNCFHWSFTTCCTRKEPIYSVWIQ